MPRSTSTKISKSLIFGWSKTPNSAACLEYYVNSVSISVNKCHAGNSLPRLTRPGGTISHHQARDACPGMGPESVHLVSLPYMTGPYLEEILIAVLHFVSFPAEELERKSRYKEVVL